LWFGASKEFTKSVDIKDRDRENYKEKVEQVRSKDKDDELIIINEEQEESNPLRKVNGNYLLEKDSKVFSMSGTIIDGLLVL